MPGSPCITGIRTMLVSFEKWQAAIQFLTQGEIGSHLTMRDQRLLALHLRVRPLTPEDARMVLARIGWYVSG
jgi:hypothetical protein